MRKLNIVLVTLASMLIMSAPAYAGVIGKPYVAPTNGPAGTAQTDSSKAVSPKASLTVDAGGAWVKDSKGWWWRNPDGSWPAGVWAWVDGNHDGVSECYYFGSDGYILVGTVAPGGYTVDANGAWTLGGVVLTKNTGTSSSTASTTASSSSPSAVSKSAGAGTGTASSASFTSDDLSAVESAYENRVIELVNTIRQQNGLSALKADETLKKIAEMRALECTVKYSHTRPDGTECFTLWDACGVGSGYCGENIASGYKTADEVMTGWIGSESHKANILNPYFKNIGVGITKASTGGYVWVQAFTG